MGKTLATDLIYGSLKVSGKFQALSTLACCARATPISPSVVSQETSDFAARLKRIIAKKAFERIGQINFLVYI